MNWEKSRALTPLKRDFLTEFFERDQSFFLTGGSALGIFYLDHRLSYDLDFFTTETVEWHILDNRVRDIASKIGANCQTLVASPDFRRFQLERGGDGEVLDFVVERVPQMDTVKERFDQIRVDTLREIVVNKICTLINRCELKDVIDLFFLHKQGYAVLDYFDEARKKEGGLDPAMISHLLSRLSLDPLPEYLLMPVNREELAAFVEGLRLCLAERSLPRR